MTTRTLASHRAYPRRTAVLGTLGFAALLSLLVLATALCERSEVNAVSTPPPNAPWAAATSRRPAGFWYLRLGLWRSDARTAVALVRYLLEPDPPVTPDSGSPSLGLAMPTNSASVVPKA